MDCMLRMFNIMKGSTLHATSTDVSFCLFGSSLLEHRLQLSLFSATRIHEVVSCGQAKYRISFICAFCARMGAIGVMTSAS